MKALSSKEPVKVIQRQKGGAFKVVNEPFEACEVSTFKPVNNTRKIHYPMMLRKYHIDRIENEDLDDFRKAVDIIVANSKKDTEKYDELFTQSLSKHAGSVAKTVKPAVDSPNRRAATTDSKMLLLQDCAKSQIKKFLSTISIDTSSIQPSAVTGDRTDPKVIVPRSHFSSSVSRQYW